MPSYKDKPTVGTVNGDELVWLIDDPSGTPADVKATVDQIAGRTFSLTAFAENVQDVIGAMFAAAGGTYNDTAGTITFPASGSSGGQASDATLTALAALSGTGVIIATGTDTFALRPTGATNATDIVDRAAGDARYAPLSAVTSRNTTVEVAAGVTLALDQAAHQGKIIVLSGVGATFTANATTLADGFFCTIRNRTGSDFVVPPFTGSTREYAKGAAHTKIASASDAVADVYGRNGALFTAIMGDTL